MKKNIAFFSLLCLFSMGVTPMVKAKVSVKPSWYAKIWSQANTTWTNASSWVSAHPYRTLGGVMGVSLLGYILYKYRTGGLSCADVKAWFSNLCPCKKQVDTAK